MNPKPKITKKNFIHNKKKKKNEWIISQDGKLPEGTYHWAVHHLETICQTAWSLAAPVRPQ